MARRKKLWLLSQYHHSPPAGTGGLLNDLLSGLLHEASPHCSALYPHERSRACVNPYILLVAKATDNVHLSSREAQTSQAMERGPGFLRNLK